MGKRTVVLIVALLLAGLSAFAIFTFLDRVEDDAAERVATVRVFRATEFVPRGVLGSDVIAMFEEADALEETLPATAIRDTEGDYTEWCQT